MLSPPRTEPEGYETFDYGNFVHDRVAAVFQDDQELIAIFKEVCVRVEEEIVSLSESIGRIKGELLRSTNR